MVCLKKYLFLLFTVTLISGCGDSSDTKYIVASSDIYKVKGAPTATVTPDDGSTISSSQAIEIVFNESMDTSTLTLSGSLSSEATYFWSKTDYKNDTLFIEPETNWTSGTQTLTVDCDDTQKESLSTLNLSYNVDTDLPTYSESIANGSEINKGDAITVTFSETMDEESLALSGTLLSVSYDITWSATTYTSDTLTVSPDGDWSTGLGQSLQIDVSDFVGNSSSTIILSYDVCDCYYFVTTLANGGDDANDGTSKSRPKATIESAIDAAISGDKIFVTIGDYSESISLKEGVDLYGNYDLEWSGKNGDASLSSHITDPTDSGGAANGPNKAVYAGSGITSKTVLDGFNITGGSGNYNSGVLVDAGASPVLTNNTIIGGRGSASNYGIYIQNSSSPVITENIIYGGTDGAGTYGIFNHVSSPEIFNNTINGGQGSTYSTGTYNYRFTAVMSGNTVNGGSGLKNSYGIRNDDTSTAVISGNNINGGDGAENSYGIYNSMQSTFEITDNSIDGGSAGQYSHGIRNTNASPTISDNNIYGGTGGVSSFAVFNFNNGAPVLKNNNIDGGDGQTSISVGILNYLSSSGTIEANTIDGGRGRNITIGIDNNNSSPLIVNNLIKGGEGSVTSRGVVNNSYASPPIVSNTIDGGKGGTSYGLVNYISSSVVINNIFFGAVTIDYCIEESSDGDPLLLESNAFYNCTVSYFDHDELTGFTNMCSGNPGNGDCSVTLATPTGTGNVLISGTDDVVADLGFESVTDWHLTVDSPISVTEGGSSTGSIFIDKDGTDRTVNWSIGAYEYD